jgi:hypothetical protein
MARAMRTNAGARAVPSFYAELPNANPIVTVESPISAARLHLDKTALAGVITEDDVLNLASPT